MIVATQAFILGSTESTPIDHPRIGWDNFLDGLLASDVSASGETAEGPKDAPLRPNTDEYWRPPTLPAWVVFDLGSSYAVNYAGIAAHNLGTCRASVQVDVGADAAFSTAQTLAQAVSPSDDSPLFFLDSNRLGRYLRVRVTGSVAPLIGVVYAGQVLAMERRVAGPFVPITLGRKTVLTRALSRGGQFLGQGFRRNGVETSAAFKNLSPAWVRNSFDAFARHARSKPYFFAWNPQGYPSEVGYVWTGEDVVPKYNGNVDNMDVEWTMQGIGT